MNQHSMKNVKNPSDRLDAVNKAYADRKIYKIATGNIPKTVMTLFPLRKLLSVERKICDMWVERLVDEWIATSSSMFGTEWPGFHKFSRGPSIMTFFTSSPASDWTHNFRLDYVELP